MLVLLVPMMAIGSFAASPSATSSPVQTYQFPGINVVVSSNTSYNLSYMYLIVKSENGLMSSSFDKDHWSITDHNNNSVTYTANLSLTSGAEFNSISSLVVKDSQSSSQQNSQNSTYSAKVIIKVSKMKSGQGTLILNNGSSTINSLGNSTISILISIYFNKEIPGNGNVYLIQSLQGVEKRLNSLSYGNFSGDFNYSSNEEVNGLLINTHPNSSSLSHDALYWWNDSYTQNGTPMTMQSTTFSDGNTEYVVFEYPFTDGVSSIVQDPYISVPGVNIFQNPITEKQITAAMDYLLVHSEYLGAGLGGGLLLLGFSYGVYRRRKF